MNEFDKNRQDDKVDVGGVPISEAHKAIYGHLDDARDEIITHITTKFDEHNKDDHSGLIVLQDPAVFGGPPDRYFQQQIKMAKEFTILADAVLGTPKAEFLGGGRQDDGLVAKNDALYQKFGNGGKIEATMGWADRTWPTLVVVIIGGIAKVFGWI